MPKTQKKAVFEYNDTEGNQTDLVMNIMNNLCFGKGKNVPAVLDGNFISIYNQKTDRHHYFCHRLMGKLTAAEKNKRINFLNRKLFSFNQ
jgi:hypothetical protein